MPALRNKSSSCITAFRHKILYVVKSVNGCHKSVRKRVLGKQRLAIVPANRCVLFLELATTSQEIPQLPV